ncbi:hypothetical protein [Micromonospora sp. NBRC 107095]|uniref:hypothetical protein n=1 Tax=Micromonospora sp. NBRC 107095 TaxID=3032209 RepID=UPI0024A257BE|nr:hypothetical protein [Micromonospora sp. NBRC 107095]GLZ57287.1 hypothetical protein Misp05_08630 [Micromonospora sp. NBRC 107095]
MVDPNSARALRPLRQLALPRWRTLLRAGLVAALLALAAAVLQTPAGCPPTVVPADAPSVADDPPRQVPSNTPSVADDPPRQVDEGRSATSGGAIPPDTTGTAGPTS